MGRRLPDRVFHHRQEVLQLRHGHPGQLAESETQQQPPHHSTRQQSGPGASERGTVPYSALDSYYIQHGLLYKLLSKLCLRVCCRYINHSLDQKSTAVN